MQSDLQLHETHELSHSEHLKYSLQYKLPTEHHIPQLSLSGVESMVQSSDDQKPEYIDVSSYFSQLQSTPMMQNFLTDGNFNYTSNPPTHAIIESKLLNDAATMSITDEMNVLAETSQAMEMSIASEVEMPTPWIDTAATSLKTAFHAQKLLPSCIALPTGIPTYVNIPFQTSTAATGYLLDDDMLAQHERQIQTALDQSYGKPDDVSLKNLNGLSIDELDEIIADRAASTLETEMPTDFVDFALAPRIDGMHEAPMESVREPKSDANRLSDTNENMVDRLLLETGIESSKADDVENDSFISELLMSIDGVNPDGSGIGSANVLMSQQYENRENSSQIPETVIGENTNDMIIVSPDSVFHSPKSKLAKQGPNDRSTATRCVDCTADDKCCSKPAGNGAVTTVNRIDSRSVNDEIANAIISSLITQAPQRTTGDCCSSSGSGSCTCRSPQEGLSNGCCVVICLKTLERLRQVIRNSATMNLIRCSSSGGVVG